jgi:hypothetical protein
MRLCECGCGQPTKLAKSSRPDRGYLVGEPLRFLRGHGGAVRKTHGMRNTPEFHAYCDAKQRCTNPNNERWNRYGGRGIKFLLESFEQFIEEIGPRPSPEYSLDRIKTDGDYILGNIRWATLDQQMASRQLSGCCLSSHLLKVSATGGDHASECSDQVAA